MICTLWNCVEIQVIKCNGTFLRATANVLPLGNLTPQSPILTKTVRTRASSFTVECLAAVWAIFGSYTLTQWPGANPKSMGVRHCRDRFIAPQWLEIECLFLEAGCLWSWRTWPRMKKNGNVQIIWLVWIWKAWIGKRQVWKFLKMPFHARAPVTALSQSTPDYGSGRAEMDTEKLGIIRFAAKICGIWRRKSHRRLEEFN